MAQIVVLMAGLLLIAESQASDVADRSTHEGFLSKYVPSGSDASQSSMSDYDKFITPNLNRMKHGNELGASPFTVVDDKPVLQSLAQAQEKQAAQELLANKSYDRISLSVFGIGLVSFVTMLGLSLWRALQPATIPTNTVSALGGQVMEMKSQESNVKVNSGRVGWGHLSSQSARPQTFCYASKQEMVALADANPDFLGKSNGLWDPLGCLDRDFRPLDNETTVGDLRHAEIQHGRVAMAAFSAAALVVPQSAEAMVIPGDSAAEFVVLSGTLNFLSLYNALITGRILLSWFPQAQGVALLRPLYQVTDPFLNAFRGLGLNFGGLDFSVLPAFFLLNALQGAVPALGADPSFLLDPSTYE